MLKLLNMVALVTLMLSVGMSVTIGELLAAARRWGVILLAALANFVVVPLAVVVLLWLFGAAPLVSVGFLILAVCPGAPMGPSFVDTARGDVPLATALMVLLAACSVVAAPLLLSVALPLMLEGSDLRVDYGTLTTTLLVTQALPLAAGIAFRRWLPRWNERLRVPARGLANLLLLVVVVLILATQYAGLLLVRWHGWCGMLLLLAVSLLTGWLAAGRDATTRRTLAVTTGLRNVAVGLVIVSASFAETLAATAVLAYALVSIAGTFAFARVVGHKAAAPNSVSRPLS
ncbi:MAG: bile acid:sodium symporter [Planctomycetes bacterium]|nr:bile acid:sodium symporter [Planctomycetota bacterium]